MAATTAGIDENEEITSQSPYVKSNGNVQNDISVARKVIQLLQSLISETLTVKIWPNLFRCLG